jgi:Glycosyltransferase 61
MKILSSFHLLWRERRFFFARAIDRFAPEGVRSAVARLLCLRRLRIRTLDQLDTAAIPVGSRDDFSVCAEFVGPGSLQNTTPHLALSGMVAHFVEDVGISLNRRGGFAVRGENILTRGTWGPAFPKIYFPNSSVGGEVFQANDYVYLSHRRTEISVPEGIYVGSFASHNWFHWIIDTLPVVLALKDLPPAYSAYPLLLPSGAIAKKSWREALEAVNPGHPVLELPPETLVGVRRLIMVDGVSNGFPRPVDWPLGVPRISLRLRAMGAYRNHILAQAGASTGPSHSTTDRIFVSRRPKTGRGYNQHQILPIARRLGFTEVYLEDMSFDESVRLFSAAKFVVAPHGAGLANALFSGPATRLLFWTWDDLRGDNWYENVFFVAGVRASRIIVTPENRGDEIRDPRGSDYFLDPSEFEARLKEMLLSST